MNWNNINEDRDTSGLGPIEYDQTKVPSLIRKHADNVRGKSYGQQVREAQARNAEYAGLIANEAVGISNETKIRQRKVESQFNAVQQEMTDKDVISAPEIIASRAGYGTLNDRLDYIDGDVKSRVLNVKFPPAPMLGAKGDGIEDDTSIIKSIFEDPKITEITIPDGIYIIDPSLEIKLVGDKKITANKGAVFKVKYDIGNWDTWLASTNDLNSLVIDGLNFDGNIENNISGHNLDMSNRQCFLKLLSEDIERVSIENCNIKSSGTNTIVVNSPTATNVNIINNTIVWKSKNPSLKYDNSVIYLNCKDHTIENNKIYNFDDLGECGIETHWGSGITTNNTVKGFAVGINATNETHSFGSEELMSVKNNHIICRTGIQLWSSTVGGVFRNVDISSNNISCVASGVTTYYGTDGIWEGDFDSLFIENNKIYYKLGTTLNHANVSDATSGIAIKCIGNVSNSTIKNNTITNAPYSAVSVLPLATLSNKGERTNIQVDGNIIINPASDSTYSTFTKKNAFIFTNKMTGLVEHNKIYNPRSHDGYSYHISGGDKSSDLIFKENMIPNNMRIRFYSNTQTLLTKELRNEYNARYDIKKHYANEASISGVFYEGDVILVGNSELRVCTVSGAITGLTGYMTKYSDGTIKYASCSGFPIQSKIKIVETNQSFVLWNNINGNINVSTTLTNPLTAGTYTIVSQPPVWKAISLT